MTYSLSIRDEFVYLGGWHDMSSMQLDAKLETPWEECFYCGVPIQKSDTLCPGCNAPRKFREPPLYVRSVISETTNPARRQEGSTDANYGETDFPASGLAIAFECMQNSFGQMFLKPVEWFTRMFTNAKF